MNGRSFSCRRGNEQYENSWAKSGGLKDRQAPWSKKWRGTRAPRPNRCLLLRKRVLFCSASRCNSVGLWICGSVCKSFVSKMIRFISNKYQNVKFRREKCPLCLELLIFLFSEVKMAWVQPFASFKWSRNRCKIFFKAGHTYKNMPILKVQSLLTCDENNNENV